MHTRSPITVIASLVLLICLTAAGAAENVVWLEVERFDRPGGWVADAQFIDQMGSPYVMAIGLGTSVKDAATTVAVPEAGRYRLWARTKDWAPEHHPGRFQIAVGGKPSPVTVGGSGKKGWRKPSPPFVSRPGSARNLTGLCLIITNRSCTGGLKNMNRNFLKKVKNRLTYRQMARSYRKFLRSVGFRM